MTKFGSGDFFPFSFGGANPLVAAEGLAEKMTVASRNFSENE